MHVFFLFYLILYNTIKSVSLTVRLCKYIVLAVSVLLPLSESVDNQCICANVHNAQHGKLEV